MLKEKTFKVIVILRNNFVRDNFVFFRYIYSFGYDDSMEDLISVNGVNNEILFQYLETNCDDNEEIFLSVVFNIPKEYRKDDMHDFVDHIESEYNSKLAGCSFDFVNYVRENELYVQTRRLMEEYDAKNKYEDYR